MMPIAHIRRSDAVLAGVAIERRLPARFAVSHILSLIVSSVAWDKIFPPATKFPASRPPLEPPENKFDELSHTFVKTILALTGLLVVWSHFASIDRIVRGEGSVVPRDHNQTIQHLEGGIMNALYVHEGQLVKAGDVLMRIDDVHTRALLEESLVKQKAYRLRAARLMVEAGASDEMVLPEGINRQSPEWQEEKMLLAMRQAKLEQELETLHTRMSQRLGELNEAQDRLRSSELERQIAAERLQIITNLRSQKAVSQLEVLEVQSANARLNALIAATEVALPRIRAAIAEVKSQMAELRYRMATEAKSELSAIHAELARIEGTILSQNDRLSRTVVRAPVQGVINHINANTIGGVIKPGDTLIDLTPDTGEVLVEARIRPSDRGELHAGLPAKVKVMAYDHTGMAPLNGEVAEVSADTLASPQGERFYRLKIKLDAGQDNLKGKVLYPGLSTQVDVVVGQRSVADYLLSPIHKFKDKAFTEAK